MNKIKLSQVKDDEILLVGDFPMSKEDFVKELKMGEHEGVEVYTTIQYKATVDAKDMIESALECEADNMYEDWLGDILQDIDDEDIKFLQSVVNEILSRRENTCYQAVAEVVIGI